MSAKQKYWFKVVIGKWEDEDTFDSEASFVYVEAWNAEQAIRKAEKRVVIS